MTTAWPVPWGPRGDPTEWSSWGEEAQWRERALPLAAKRAIRNLCRRRGARRPRRAIHLPGVPPGAPARRAHRFWCQKRWENHQGLRFLRWLRVDFHRRRPWRLRPWIRGPWRRWAVIGWKEPGRHRRPPHWLALAVTGAPAEAQRSGFGGERRPSGGNELSGLPGSERSVAWADDAAPRAARIGITLQALTAAALYRLGPPGRRWCHAAERSWRLWRHTAHSESAPPVGRGLAPAGADEGLRVQRTGIYIQ